MKTIYILAGYQQDGAEYCKIGDKGFEDGTSQVRVDEYYGTTGYGKDNEGYIRSAGRLNLDFERMTLINNNKLSYYYPLKKYNASYDSIVMQNNVTTYDDIYAYVNQQSDELKEAFYTALGRERESKYRANNSVDFYSVLILGNSGGRNQYEEVVKCITNKLNEDENIQATYIFSNDGTFLTETLEEQKEKYHLIIEESLTWASIISTDKLISAFNSTNIMTIGNDNTASNISLIKSAEYAGDRTYVAAKMTNLGEKVLKDMQPLGNSSDTGQYVIKFKDEVDVLYTGTYTGKKEGEFDLIGYVKNNNYKWIHSQFSFKREVPNDIEGLIRLVKFGIEGTGKNNEEINERASEGLIREFDAKNNTGIGYNGSTTTWKDLNGNSDGIVNGAIWNGEYLSLDGVDDWVNLGQISTDAPITIEATIMINSSPNRVNYIMANVNNGGVELYTKSSGCFAWSVWDVNSSDYIRLASTVKANIGQKYHIVGTFDGEELELYIDGNLVANKKYTGTYGPPIGNTVLAIGVNPKGNIPDEGFGYTNMKVYSARIYNRVLTAQEIKQNCEASK